MQTFVAAALSEHAKIGRDTCQAEVEANQTEAPFFILTLMW